MRKVVTTAVVVLILSSALTARAQAVITPCKVGSQAPAFGFWTWAPNSTVKVYILATDFKPEEKAYLLAPIDSWNSVSAATRSGVKFEYVGDVKSRIVCENCLTIMRDKVFDKTKRHATQLRTYSVRGDQFMAWAHIVIDVSLTNPDALTNAVAHELGHSLGLLDCYTCKSKTTVMIQFKEINTSNGMTGPTECDVVQLRAAFRELVARMSPEPKKETVEEEDERPVDDDTPVTVKKP
jgi:hypothetical protein